MTTPFKPKIVHTEEPDQSGHRIDKNETTAFFYMSPEPRPCFNPELLKEFRHFQQTTAQHVRAEISSKGESTLKYTVLASNTPGIFNLGGDLQLFLELIQNKDKDGLLAYAAACIDIVHEMSISMALPITTIALIQGSAQGGGFEAALSCNIIIAEKGTQMGFPEVLFNLFPGMGAYSFLRQRINTSLAEHIILSGKLYRAEELHEMGIVDILAEPGNGDQELKDYIRHANRKSNAHTLIRHTRNMYNKASYSELMEITNLWVDCAMSIGEREIKTINRLIRAQDRKMASLTLPNKNRA